MLAVCCAAQAQDTAPLVSGQVRLQWDDVHANTAGPLAASHALQSGIADLPASGATVQTELRASGQGITAVVTLQQLRNEGQATHSQAWVNELVASYDAGAWQFSAGKKIVSWDVGYGYRPNDMVQQEVRRTLVSSTPEGRPMLLAEHFITDTAWSLVWVNPTALSDTLGAQEPALAARLYQRSGAADWYGFARIGAHTGTSLGAALAWVATNELELHSSLRYAERVDSTVMRPAVSGLQASNPWQSASEPDVAQLLLGAPGRTRASSACWLRPGGTAAHPAMRSGKPGQRATANSAVWQVGVHPPQRWPATWPGRRKPWGQRPTCNAATSTCA